MENQAMPCGKKITYVCLFILYCCSAGWCGKIVYPWNATTAIVKAGECFTVWFEADAGQTVTSAVLKGPYNTVRIPSIASEEGTWQYDDRSLAAYNTRITVSVPTGIPEERYDLVLNTSSGRQVSPRAVKVIKEYRTQYSIFHMSDMHLCRSRETFNGFPSEIKNFSALVDIANILGPEIVLVTGDIVNANRSDIWPDPQTRWDYFYKGIPAQEMAGVYDLQAAVFSIPGNHDYQENLRHSTDPAAQQARTCAGKAAFWNKYCGLTDYCFVYGNSRFIGVNNGWVDCGQTAHLANADAWLREVGPGKLRITFYHLALHHLDDLAPWEYANRVQLAMAGHNHHRGTMDDPDGNPFNRKASPLIMDDPANRRPEGTGYPLRYIVNSSVEHQAFNLFRVDDRSGKYTVVNPPKGNLRAFSGDGTPNLTLEFGTENNGTSPANTATLVNRFDVSFPNARVRFVMPKESTYVVLPETATIEQAFDGDLYHIVDVRVPLEAETTTQVKISTPEQISQVRPTK
jgi:predicted MPP superfamily phosphohydrolase